MSERDRNRRRPLVGVTGFYPWFIGDLKRKALLFDRLADQNLDLRVHRLRNRGDNSEAELHFAAELEWLEEKGVIYQIPRSGPTRVSPDGRIWQVSPAAKGPYMAWPSGADAPAVHQELAREAHAFFAVARPGVGVLEANRLTSYW